MILEKLCGFTVTRQKELPELEARLLHMVHDRTGLELVWLKREEENKTFGIAFETLPWDDTGVFHILEHSVLCGSDKYPVKEPFVELLKSSMNTFLNAMTFPDKTFYPVSSRNDKDFQNLMRVYLDAVFHPLIYSKPEIFHQEGWHYELDENGNAGYKGVVFNEMKGALASADEIVVDRLNRMLFPDTPYRFNYGGDPAAIPDLTYEAFVDSHRRFYAPSNAYVFLDGDMDIEAILGILNGEYLQFYEKTQRMAPPPIQAPVTGAGEDVYELAANEDPEGKVRLAFGSVVGTFAQREKLIAAQVLAETLCGSNQSVLSRAVLSAGLAEEIRLYLNDSVAQPWLMMDVRNVKEENLEPVQTLIRDQLRSLADTGLDHSQLEAVMANLEFKLRERDFGYAPQGLIFGMSVLESWLYGGAPEANLEVGSLFTNLKEKMAAGYFEELLREVLLENPHSAQLILRPSHNAGEIRRGAEQARLDAETGRWTAADRERVAAQQEVLLAWQNSTDTPEALATIPQLALADIPAEPERIPTQVLELAGILVLAHAVHTGGIAYVSLYFDADSCDEQALSLLSLGCGLLGQTGTRDHSAQEILNRTRLLCGHFRTYPVVYPIAGEPGRMTVKLCVSFSALVDNLFSALELVTEILTRSVFTESEVREVLRQTKMQIFERMVMNGHSVGMSRVDAQTSPAGVAEEAIGGLTYYRWLKEKDENWDYGTLHGALTDLLNSLISRSGMTLSMAGVEENRVEALAEAAAGALPEGSVLPSAQIRPWGIRKEGIVIPADISFAVMGGNVGECSGQMQLAAQMIGLGYLWNAIRVQGGAYGAGLVTREAGLTAAYSYRDPNGPGSLVAYRGCGSFLRDFVRESTDFTGFIIGTVANNSPLMTPKTKARTGDRLYFTRVSWEDRCARRRQLLGATAEDLTAIAELLDRTMAEGGVCMVGAENQLKACPELDTIHTL